MVGPVGTAERHPLRLARIRERFTLRQLASVTGLRHPRIFAIENGARPSHIEARLLSAALRIPLTDLLPAQQTEGASRA